VPISRWSLAELHAEGMASGLAAEVSTATVRRWLAQDAIRPWQHRSWIFPRDPDFAAKATRVLDLYARVFQGQGLGSGEYVISADEKTSIQARCRCHPTLPPGRTRVMRIEHEGRPWRRAGLSRRMGRPPGAAVRPLRAHHWDRAVRTPGRPGHDRRAVHIGQAGVLGGR
jgi:hypothetical protein